MGSKTGKLIAGIGLVVGGAAIGVFTGQWSLAFAVASTGVGLLTSPTIGVGPDKEGLTDRQGSVLENRTGSRESLPLVYGTTRIAPIVVDLRTDPNSVENKRLVVVAAFCHGSRDGTGINAIKQVFFDDREAISTAGAIQFPFSKLTSEHIGTSFARHLEYGFNLGSTTQVVDSRLAALFPTEWPTAATGKGVAYARLELYYNSDVYGGGVPNIQAVIEGNKVYDPRDSTWKFSDNPALCIRDYLLSAIYGLGVPAANINEQSFIDMANYCDELVTNPDGGTYKRFTLNGWVDTARSVDQNLAELCTACRGQVVNEGDQWRLVIRRERAVSGFKITEKNTLEGSWKFILPGAQAAANIARVTYVDPNRNYSVDTVQWPDPGTTNPFLTDDNSYEQRLEMDLPYTNARSRAQQIAMTLVKEGREAIGVICTLKEDAVQCRIGDLVQVTYPTPGWTDKVFDVAALLLQQDGGVQAVLVEYEPTTYDLDTQFPTPSIPDTSLPNPFTVAAPSPLNLSANEPLQTNDGRYIPRIRATWGKVNDPFIDYYDVQARRLLATDVVEWPVGTNPFPDAAFTHSGLSAFNASLIWNGNTTDQAWHTDTAVAGAWLQLDCGSGVTKEFVECRIWITVAPYAGTYAIEYSDNGSSWTQVSTISPSATGLNIARWTTAGAHRYWRIRLTNTPGSGSWLNELNFMEPAWDSFGRVRSDESPLCYVYPATDEQWSVRVCAVNRIGVKSAWTVGTITVVTDDPRPQILSITLANAHADTHSDIAHSDVAHSDAAHTDNHSDVAHDDSHLDMHTDSHTDSHSDSHSDIHGDGDLHMDSHADSHSDVAHGDATQSDHGDTAHSDTHTDVGHSDSAHADSHTDAHSDGQYGIGVALQADNDSASVKAVARKYKQYVVNGDGEQGTVGSQATGWTLGAGNGLLVANDFAYEGGRSLKIDNPSPADSYSYQEFAVVTGQLYEVSAYIKTSSVSAGGGAFINVNIVSGITSFTIVEKVTVGTDPNASQPDCGINGAGTHDWVKVSCRFTVAANGTVRLYCELGYDVNVTGTAWFDRVRLEMAEPNAADVRLQPAKNGRNVVIELIDAATGAQIILNPGDVARIAALAYADVNAGGVEGPLALGTGTLFNVAPTGADKWVPA